MEFLRIELDNDGLLIATATGHPTVVIEEFHALSKLLLERKGPWRIDYIEGRFTVGETERVDSDMLWTLRSSPKKRLVP
jgi:hypothetical protein